MYVYGLWNIDIHRMSLYRHTSNYMTARYTPLGVIYNIYRQGVTPINTEKNKKEIYSTAR